MSTRLSKEIINYPNDPVRYIEDKLLMPALRSDDAPTDQELALDLMEKCWGVEGLMYEALYECACRKDPREAARIFGRVLGVLEDIPNKNARDCLTARIRELFDCYGPKGPILRKTM